jgi:exosortase A
MTVNSRLPAQFILIILPMVLIPLVLIPSSLSMIHVWQVNETFTHGFLILPIAVWMLWHKIDELRLLPISPEPWVLLLIAPISLAWFVAYVVDVQVVQHFALVFLIQTSIWLLLGRQVVITYFFPLAFLTFMVPVGQGLIPIMMDFTADFTVTLIQLSGIPVYQDGLYFILPSGNWSVVEECSGVRYLIASFALGTLYAYMTYESLKKRLIFILFSILIPIIANGLRAYGIVMIGHLSDMELATGVDHLIYGWVFFGIVIFVMFLIGSFWADQRPAYDSQLETKLEIKTPIKKPFLLLGVTLSMLLGLLLHAQSIGQRQVDSDDHLAAISIAPPSAFGNWFYEAENHLSWRPIIKNPTLAISRLYKSGNHTVQLDIGYFLTQSNESEAVSTQNSVVPYGSDDWKKLRSTNLQRQDIRVMESEIQSPSQTRLLVWQWYQIGSYDTHNPYIAKAFDAYNQIISQRGDAAYITLATPLGDDTESSRKVLQTFWRDASSSIRQQIGQAYFSQL